ncbi:hypothetical protein [Fuchsiella alkaliacetigena]|nr:hypothetical protein [Fuchsiella alkaliacetigena]MCK8826108.1 hypothetical protein [Fuchsiella alkaliacetigena]
MSVVEEKLPELTKYFKEEIRKSSLQVKMHRLFKKTHTLYFNGLID